MTENVGSKKAWAEPDAQGRVLDERQFPELNAVFYSADPSEFIKMRVESLALMACKDEPLLPHTDQTVLSEIRFVSRARQFRILSSATSSCGWKRSRSFIMRRKLFSDCSSHMSIFRSARGWECPRRLTSPSSRSRSTPP